ILTETLVVTILGGVMGFAIAVVALRMVVINAPMDLPRLNELRPDGAMLAITLSLSLMSALLCGWIPAWLSSRVDPQAGLRSGGRTATDNKQSRRWGSSLVSVETALCTVSLVAAGLLLNSFVRLLRVETGFKSEHVITMDLHMPPARYADLAQRSQFLER